MEENRGTMVRTNTRVWPDQNAFIKKMSVDSKGAMGEGEVHRLIIDDYINRVNKKKK